MLALVCCEPGGGVEPVSSGPILILLSFKALPSAAVIQSASQRWTGVLVLLGVGSALVGGGELAVISSMASGVSGI